MNLKLKSLIKLLHHLLFLMLIFIHISCEESENQSDTSGVLIIENTSYALDKGVLENWGTSEENDELDENYEGYLLGLTLLSPEVIIHQTDGRVDSLSEEGHGIYFRVIADSPAEFTENTFEYSGEMAPGKILYSAAMIHFDFLHDGHNDYVYVNEGTLSINKTDDQYVIEFDGLILPDRKIEVQYIGKLVTFDVGL